jgi:hypothetical protein
MRPKAHDSHSCTSHRNIHNLTPPAVETLATTYVEIGPEFREHRGGQSLGENVSELGGRRSVEDTNVSDSDALVDKVEINLNILCALVLDGVGGEIDHIDIVVVDEGSLR